MENKSGKRYFLIFFHYSGQINGSGSTRIVTENNEYLNSKGAYRVVSKCLEVNLGQDLAESLTATITNIIELSEEDFEQWTK